MPPIGYLNTVIAKLQNGSFESDELNLTRTSLENETLEEIVSLVLSHKIPIKSISLEEIEELDDESAALLCRIESLRRINISLNNIGPKGAKLLAGLKHLEYLDISSNHIGDDGLLALSQSQSLRELDASCCNLTRPGIDKVLQLPNLALTKLDVYESYNHPVNEHYQKEVTERLQNPKPKKTKSSSPAYQDSPLHKASQYNSCRTRGRNSIDPTTPGTTTGPVKKK